MTPLVGHDYVAVVNLSTRDGLVAAAGDRCDFVPVESLENLLRDGKICAAPSAPEPEADKGSES